MKPISPTCRPCPLAKTDFLPISHGNQSARLALAKGLDILMSLTISFGMDYWESKNDALQFRELQAESSTALFEAVVCTGTIEAVSAVVCGVSLA